MIDPDKLRTAREAKGLNPSQLAIQAGLARNVVHRLEDGTRGKSVRVTTVARLAHVLGVEVESLILDEPPEKVSSDATPQGEALPPSASVSEPNPEAWRWGN